MTQDLTEPHLSPVIVGPFLTSRSLLPLRPLRSLLPLRPEAALRPPAVFTERSAPVPAAEAAKRTAFMAAEASATLARRSSKSLSSEL